MRLHFRFTTVLLILLILTAMLLPFAGVPVHATSSDVTTSPTDTEPGVAITSIYIIGSNNKYYYFDQKITKGANSGKTYNLPDWMSECTVVFVSEAGLKVKCNSADFNASGNRYEAEIALNGKSVTLNVTLTKNDKIRELELTLVQSKNNPLFKNIALVNASDKEQLEDAGSADSGYLSYSLDSGARSGYTLRITPGQEEYVYVTNLTGIPENEITGNERKTQLNLIKTDLCYDYMLSLVEGTNRFLITVIGGTAKIECDVSIIVGDPNANAATTTTQSTLPPETTTLPPEQTTLPTASGIETESGSSLSAIVWVLIGIVIAVVIAACIYMIVSVSTNNDVPEGYEYDYNQPAVRTTRRRSDYADDFDYMQQPAPRGGYYPQARGYDDYRQRSGYDSYGYPPQNIYDDYDDFGYDEPGADYPPPPQGAVYDDFTPRFPRQQTGYIDPPTQNTAYIGGVPQNTGYVNRPEQNTGFIDNSRVEDSFSDFEEGPPDKPFSSRTRHTIWDNDDDDGGYGG